MSSETEAWKGHELQYKQQSVAQTEVSEMYKPLDLTPTNNLFQLNILKDTVRIKMNSTIKEMREVYKGT